MEVEVVIVVVDRAAADIRLGLGGKESLQRLEIPALASVHVGDEDDFVQEPAILDQISLFLFFPQSVCVWEGKEGKGREGKP